MITLLLIVPIIGSLILILIKENKLNNNLMRNIALITSLVNLFVSIIIWIEFDFSTSQYQFVYEFNHLSSFHFNLGIDAISLVFLLLTTFITPIALLSNYLSITNSLKLFLISILLLETLQIALFIVLDLFLFYIFFESILPIFFILIIIYGSGENKIRSAILLFLYTFAGAWWFRKSSVCLQLSNSGDFLKLLVPSYIWKIIYFKKIHMYGNKL
jgi:NADH-ubiquinone oxidoreductase chain 4